MSVSECEYTTLYSVMYSNVGNVQANAPWSHMLYFNFDRRRRRRRKRCTTRRHLVIRDILRHGVCIDAQRIDLERQTKKTLGNKVSEKNTDDMIWNRAKMTNHIRWYHTSTDDFVSVSLLFFSRLIFFRYLSLPVSVLLFSHLSTECVGRAEVIWIFTSATITQRTWSNYCKCTVWKTISRWSGK